MRRMRGWLVRLASFGKRRRHEEELSDELASHLQLHIDDNLRLGMSRQDARRQALIQLGGIEATKEACRDQRGVPWLESLLRHAGYAFRMLWRNPSFTAVAVLTVGLCLGANLTIFAVLNSVLLRPLPFPQADRLVTMFNSYPRAGVDRDGSSLANYYDRRGQIPAFSQLALLRAGTAVVGEAGAAERVDVSRVSPEFFATLGIGLARGRTFAEEETTYANDDVVILTDAEWRVRFAADPHGARPVGPGRWFAEDDHRRAAPALSLSFVQGAAVFAARVQPGPSGPSQRHSGGGGTDLIARLKPGSTVREAQAQI